MVFINFANQFLNMETFEKVVANSFKLVSKIWNHWNMGLKTFANQFLNGELLKLGVANSFKSVSKYGTV